MRRVRLDDRAPRMGQSRKRSPYEKYLALICRCGDPGAHPPCGGCTSAISEEDFAEEFARLRPEYIEEQGAINEIAWDRHYAAEY